MINCLNNCKPGDIIVWNSGSKFTVKNVSFSNKGITVHTISKWGEVIDFTQRSSFLIIKIIKKQ